MKGFFVLQADVPHQLRDWLELWEQWPEREVSAHPNYVALFAKPGDKVVSVGYCGISGVILFPLLLRPLSREPWVPDGCNWLDATTPYGYGGPFCWNCSPLEVRNFWRSLRCWASECGLVSLFARLSLFPEQLANFEGNVLEDRPNVVRTLELQPDKLWMDYEHKVRKNVKRAVREGVHIFHEPGVSHLEDFLEIYYQTMDRRSAATNYYFQPDFFYKLATGLAGKFVFFYAEREKKIISAELVLVSQKNIYSFLGGTRADALDLRANDLLKHEIILWGINTNKRSFVLGGGHEPNDGIFRYKLSFAPKGVVPFRTGQIVFDQAALSRLVVCRNQWESSKGRSWIPKSNFFPPYRS
jgi:hypothetical protein